MKKLINSSLFVLAVMILTAGYTKGQSGKETRNVSDFNEVGFGIAGHLHIKFGSAFSVVLEGDKEYLEQIETVVRNGKLIIRSENHNFFNFSNHEADVYITMPSIKSLGVSGSGRASVEDAIKAETLDLSVSGSGKIVVNDLRAEDLHCGISGSGDILLNGTGEVQKGDFSISGSGDFKGENVKVASLEVGISGSGSCSCNVSDNLKASVSGSGNVWYSGNPRLDVRSSGSGHVRSR
jgi:Putative auto-transporter adhesin, head GIN domain